MRSRTTILVAVAILCVLIVAYGVRVVAAYTYHDDACLVISMLVADRAEKGESVSDVDIGPEIARLIRASVIHGRVDGDGEPTDLNGNAFLIHESAERVTVSTRFSLLQPIRSHGEAYIKSHNKPAAGNAGFAPQLAIGHRPPGVAEL